MQGAWVPVYSPNGTEIAYVGCYTTPPKVWQYCQRWIPSWGGWYMWVAVPPTPYRFGWLQNSAVGNMNPDRTFGKAPGVAMCQLCSGPARARFCFLIVAAPTRNATDNSLASF